MNWRQARFRHSRNLASRPQEHGNKHQTTVSFVLAKTRMPEFLFLTVIGFKCYMKESKTGSLAAACFIMRQNKICWCQNFSQLERSLFKSRGSGVVVKFKFIILRERKIMIYIYNQSNLVGKNRFFLKIGTT